ncbi:MAG: hypothetical protein LC808_06195 [Actinobacteria bacterium]|nr:hypothetical protein [Actinomycetota bacterium]
MRRRTPILVAALTVASVLAVASSAWADAGEGVKTNQTFCEPTPFGTTCFDLNYVSQETTTPSGNTIVVVNGTNTITSTYTSGVNAGCTFTRTSDFHSQYLLRPGETEAQEVQVTQGKSENSFTRDCPSGTRTCTTKLHAHRVGPDYRFQFNRVEIIGDCGG